MVIFFLLKEKLIKYLCLKHINKNGMKDNYQKQGFTKSYEND